MSSLPMAVLLCFLAFVVGHGSALSTMPTTTTTTTPRTFLSSSMVDCCRTSVVIPIQQQRRRRRHPFVSSQRFFMTNADYVEEDDTSSSSTDDDFVEDLGDACVRIDDLSWRVEKMRLEEQNKQRFLKAKPRFLPYEDATKWVQAWGQRWKTKQDWQDWIMMGEKRNSYIPSRPEEYYRRTGEWISWDHFLGVNRESSPGP